MNLLTRSPDHRGGDRDMISHVIGNALVVHPRNVLRDEVRDMALNLAADPDHELVVVDLPPASSFSVWESAAKLLPRKRRGVRLVIGGGRTRETTVLAGQWFSERLGRTVIAPDGTMMPGVGGSLFVDAGWGTGWVRFQPGKPPKRDGKRFPRPTWETVSPLAEVMPTSAGGVTEPLPGGAWLRPRGPESVLREHRQRLIETLPCQPDVCTVVLGCPGAPPITLYDVTRFWSWLPEELRATLRLVRFGPMTLPDGGPYGQHVADALGEQVICYNGMPVGSRTEPTVVTLRSDGTLGWQSFALEVGYFPAQQGQPAPLPTLLSYRDPLFGIEEIEPAVYQYTQGVVLEVVPAGLWVRSSHEVSHAAAVRSAEPDGGRHLVLFEESVDAAAQVRQAAVDLLGRLDSQTRRLSGLVPALSVARQRIEVGGKAWGVVEPVLGAEPAAPLVPVSPAPFAPQLAHGVVEAPVSAPFTVDAPSLETATVRIDRSQPAPQAAATPAMPPLISEALAPPVLAAPPPELGYVPEFVRAESPAAVPPVLGTPPRASVPVTPVSAPGLPVAEAPAGPVPARATEVPAAPSLEPPAPSAVITAVQPTPSTAAAALVPQRGLDEERAWLRRTLSQEYAAVSNSVSRVLSEHPGFQGALERSSGAVLSDAVAIRLYLSPQGDGLDQSLRTGGVGPHVPFARCVVSGLSRLPSHRGTATFSTSLTDQEWEFYSGRKLLTDWGFINALSAPCARQSAQNDVDVLIWSMTARRTKLLEPEAGPTAERVLFVPGTSFKVLDLTAPAGGERGQLLLRELAAGEIDPSGRVDGNRASLDELALNSLRRSAQTWEQGKKEARVPEAALVRFAQQPGMVRTTTREEGR